MTSSAPPDTLDTPEHWLASLGLAQPLYATAPTPGARNELAKVEKVAAALKTPLLPWQRYFIRVATELNPDGTYRYRSVVLTVPRQSGKTTVIRALYATRALTNRNRKSFIFAQTGKDAKERLFELSEQLTQSPVGKQIRTRRAAENPTIIFPTGSKIQSFPPTAESTHGYNFSDAFLDEIFAFDDSTGTKLMGAIVPAMQTHKDRQICLVSTKGTPDSTFLNGWIKKGREAVQNPDAPIAYFEWALADGLDAFDPDNWDFHPGLQGGLITKEDIESAATNQTDMSKGEFTRGFMNRQTETLEAVLDLPRWNALQGVLTTPKRSEVAIAYEVSFDRSKSAIVAAWKDGKTTQTRVLMNGAGTDWLQPALESLADARPMVIGADKYPQNLVIADSLNQDNPDLKLKMLTPEGAKTGAVSFKARIEDGTIRHDGHNALRTAISTAQTRPMGEGWCFSHKSEPELLAAVVACRLLDETKAEVAPMMYFGE
ncbi:terminase large subunit domain-containing protein [Paenarthrobacter nicotinovorans]|uniref:terminase large subunit domain-containing protein n=1 Tax=Paenarthrobacter nicotinovorans TaxID=29320 RepID=UPI00119DA207|nr:terminase family protein [Paenarthrobacter nicotinovorans]